MPGSRRAPRGSCALAVALALTGCGPRTEAAAVPPETPAACESRKGSLVAFVAALPERTVATPTRVELPVSGLGAVPGGGGVIELSNRGVFVDGEPLSPGDAVARIAPQAPGARPEPLYVAASGDVDVQTLHAFLARVPAAMEVRLLVRAPPHQGTAPAGDGTKEARELAARILLEADGRKRAEIAADGYASLGDCPALLEAVNSVGAVPPQKRWLALKAALAAALPSCECRKLDTASLRVVIAAEQRAGAASLGWVPFSFLRDERCDASMPLRSVKTLVAQIDEFDAEFSGVWQKDSLTFGNVIADDRLRVYFCDALPGETVARMQRTRATLYFRPAAGAGCEAWRFEPVASGTPMGTWRRAPGSSPPLAFHYWQAAEEIRLFGPVDPSAPSKPTDERDHPCDETVRFTSIDEESIQLETGKWFYSEDACRRAADEKSRFTGCLAAHAAGVLPKKAEAEAGGASAGATGR